MSERRALSQLTDDEVESLYVACGENAAKAAREVGCGPSTFKERISLIRDPKYQAEKERRHAASFILEELEARGIDPREVKVGAATVRTEKKRWQGFHKDAEGEAIITPLKADSRLVTIKFSPKFEDGPKWPVLQPATVRKDQLPLTWVKVTRTSPSATRKVFVWPDTQIGYYRDVVTGALTPFHDEQAISVAMQILTEFHPDEIVVLGDFLDLASMSRWLQVAEFQLTLQPAIQYGFNLLSSIRKQAPEAKIVYLAGNHERRLSEYVATNAKSAYGIRAAVTDPDLVDPVTLVPKRWEWPQLSIVKLLHLEELGIEYSAEYPGGQHWLSPKLVCTHQPPLRSSDLRATVIHGHIPKAQITTRTVTYYHGTEEYSIVAVPGLMRTDDVVDRTALNRTSTPSNGSRMDWQQGVATVEIFSDDLFDVQVHRIKGGQGIFRGWVYKAETSK
jgi:hypothetical protein